MAVALRDLERGRARPALRVVHSRPPVPPTPPGVYRLRRILVLAVLIAVLAAAVMAARAATASVTPAPERIEITVVLAQGETLWDLARHYAPAGADRSAWAVDVAARNGLDPAAISAGTPVVVPIDGHRVVAAPQGGARR